MEENLLEEYRKEIDPIDKRILVLFESRLDISKKVATYKHERGLEIFYPSREKLVIEKWKKGVSNEEYSNYAEDLIRKIMDISKDLQNKSIE